MTENAGLTLHTDKYEINMMYAHWVHGTQNERTAFEVSFRKLPFGGGYAVAAGLERIVRYLEALRFGETEIAYLRTQEERYPEAFLEELRRFRFTGELYAVPEGTLVFPNEPLVRVVARVFEAQLVETAVLNFFNYQTLVATKASRVKLAAGDDAVLEFGSRRAQEADAAVWGARAAYIAGFDGTSNLLAGMRFGIPASGTHAHSWVQAHESEAEAFDRYAQALPDQVTLLVDTYDTLRSGVPNAIDTAKRLEAQGKRMNAIRLDSGDLSYLSQQARRMLDEAGLGYVRIVATNDLDENLIADLKSQGARIDMWGVGTQLITAFDQPALGGVYKMVALERDGEWEPVIKISGNPEKVSNPGIKDVYRIVSRKTGKAVADYIALQDEDEMKRGARLKLFDPVHPYLSQEIEEYDALSLLQPIVLAGKTVYAMPTLDAIRAYHRGQLELFWPQQLRRLNPETYPIDLSEKAWQLKMELIRRHRQ